MTEGGRGHASIEDSVHASIQRLDYIQKRGERLITTNKITTDKTRTNRITITRKQKWEEKQLYGRFKRLINNISHKKTWTMLRKLSLKREPATFLIAAQNNTIRTNHIKVRHNKTADSGYVEIEMKQSIT